ncbi:MAG: hypothetical protein SPL39_02885 [Selenomonadaceae bacterium]|nr:hypothetical protein [Selenomonadaceae bacterium]
MAEEAAAKKPDAPTYPVDALALSKHFADRRDAVIVALDPEKQYTLDEAEKAIDAWLAQPVKEEVNGGDR